MCTDGWVNGWLVGWLIGCMDGWMGGGWMAGWMAAGRKIKENLALCLKLDRKVEDSSCFAF